MPRSDKPQAWERRSARGLTFWPLRAPWGSYTPQWDNCSAAKHFRYFGSAHKSLVWDNSDFSPILTLETMRLIITFYQSPFHNGLNLIAETNCYLVDGLVFLDKSLFMANISYLPNRILSNIIIRPMSTSCQQKTDTKKMISELAEVNKAFSLSHRSWEEHEGSETQVKRAQVSCLLIEAEVNLRSISSVITVCPQIPFWDCL